jgi:flagellar FliL protein
MAEASAPQDAASPKRSKLPLLIGLVGAAGLGAGGFFAAYSGLLPGMKVGEPDARMSAEEHADIAFVSIEPMILSLGPAADSNHLRFGAELEVSTLHQPEVALLLPRILDVLNGYLRAVEVSELEDPSALVRLRAQMLRRVQLVTGEGRIRDLLITEFVLN